MLINKQLIPIVLYERTNNFTMIGFLNNTIQRLLNNFNKLIFIFVLLHN